MDCPFCGKEMQEGTIPSRDRLKWQDRDAVFWEGIPLSKTFQNVQAFFCSDCRQIVIPVPEVEGMWNKVQRKMDEASKKLGTVQEKWKEQREEIKQQKKREKIGQKDPWEL